MVVTGDGPAVLSWRWEVLRGKGPRGQRVLYEKCEVSCAGEPVGAECEERRMNVAARLVEGVRSVVASPSRPRVGERWLENVEGDIGWVMVACGATWKVQLRREKVAKALSIVQVLKVSIQSIGFMSISACESFQCVPVNGDTGVNLFDSIPLNCTLFLPADVILARDVWPEDEV